ncbi:MAG: AraC family transcriptional regulator [Oscillospiraceae bacterium]|jgi:AraC-like DNA-binding protein|nr:AraC family transcriptional regulator [Oscillospiraceae bacterium]
MEVEMELPDNAAAVRRMQRYMETHLDEEISLTDLAGAAGYSKYHAARVFKALTHRAPLEAVRALRLTRAARALQEAGGKVVDAAMAGGFGSHDGFTRAFAREFGVTPQKYRAETPPVRWFVPHSIEAYYRLKEGETPMRKERVSRTVTVTVTERPARKIIFLRIPPTATDYFSACAAVGCDWEGYYKSIPEAFDSGAGGRLPPHLVKPGTGGDVFFVEVPLDYGKPIPEGYETAELPPCTYLYFCGMPFEDQNDFPAAIGIMNEAVENYPFGRFGWKRSNRSPDLGMGAEAETGARFAAAVERV